MARRNALFIGAATGLLVSGAVLALLWYGVSGILFVNHIDLMHIVWPSSIMLTTGWRCTVPGVMITASSVAINCLLYMAVAYSLWAVVRLVTHR